jgi:carboxymethylenebutenolidase
MRNEEGPLSPDHLQAGLCMHASGLLGILPRPLIFQTSARRDSDNRMERKKASDFPQELLDIFDHYVHGEISRREFLDAAQKHAVSGLTALALLEALRPNYALAQQVPKDDSRLKTEYVTVPSLQGNGSIRGYFVRPAKATGKLPAVLVIHENRGLNPYIEDVARRLGTQNYMVFAPDGLTSRRISRR